MPLTRLEHFRSELRRLRSSLRGAVHEAEAPAQPLERHHAVPAHLRITDVMEGDLATVLPESPIAPAVRLMIEHRISSVPVVDASGRIAGALNEKDLMKVFYELDTACVADVMTRNPIVVSIDAPLVDVIDHLMASDFRRVLIQDRERLVGVITRSHVMPALLAALEEGALARPTDPRVH